MRNGVPDNWRASGNPRVAPKATPRVTVALKADADFDEALSVTRGVAEWMASKFTDDDVIGDAVYQNAALAYLAQYTGNMPFMRAVWQYFTSHKMITLAQAVGVLNVLRAEVQSSRQIRAKTDANTTPREAAHVTISDTRAYSPEESVPGRVDASQSLIEAIPDGFYTVVMEDGSHVTIRLRVADRAFFTNVKEGTQVAAYLSGPDNENAYTGFAFVQGVRSNVWSRFKVNTRLSAALRTLLYGDPGEAGKRYAIASGRCWRCNRTLTTPESIARGMGPECASK